MKVTRQILLLLFICSIAFSASPQDEFIEWNPGTADTIQQQENQPTFPTATVQPAHNQHDRNGQDYWLIGTILATIAAGFLVRFRTGRYLRPFFLVASVAVLGFYHGSCPCPVGGFNEAVLFIAGSGKLHWVWWFVAMIPLTYLFGRVWCGWVCQLGALQELLYMNGKFKVLTSPAVQRWFKYIQLTAFVLLIAQLLYAHTNFWKYIDPFKAAFNMVATNTTSWVLLGVVVVSSILMYRPFCKSICPVGLVLGWIAKIPGSATITATGKCIGCKVCSTACRTHALQYNKAGVTLNHEECIACGECLDNCPVQVMHVQQKGGKAGITILHQGKMANAVSAV